MRRPSKRSIACTTFGLLVFGCSKDVASTLESGSTGDDGGASSGPPTATDTIEVTSIDPSASSDSEAESTTMGDASTTAAAECGNDMIEGAEQCDGIDLAGEDCMSQGFDSGVLACQADCQSFDHAGCAFAGCGNRVVETGEVCDTGVGDETCATQGFDSGVLACAEDCVGYDTTGCGMCGNAVIDGDEICDDDDVADESCETQGFDSGSLTCAVGCAAFDTSVCGTCGDAILDAEEVCDTTEFAGETCETLGLQGGDLGCSVTCGYDVAGCDIPGLPFGSDTGYSGYYFDPPSLPCEDISDTGTATGLFDDDNVEVAIGFTFPLYDVGYDMVTIESNGALHFADNTYLDYENECLPAALDPAENNIYAVWDDLNPEDGGQVYYETLGPMGDQLFIVQWDTNFYDTIVDDHIVVQAMLAEATGEITICYADMDSPMAPGESGASATAGIQQDPMNSLEFSCESPELTTGRQIFYVPI